MTGLKTHGSFNAISTKSLRSGRSSLHMIAGAERNTEEALDEQGLGTSLGEWAVRVLQSGEMEDKVRASEAAAKAWKAGKLDLGPHSRPPDRPARPANVAVVDWKDTGVGKQKKSLQNEERRVSLIHSIAHIESYAIDLSWDAVARFDNMPAEYYDDWVQVAMEETLHYQLLAKRLQELGSHYGAWPTHDGLWTAAVSTAEDHVGRMAVVHTVHEARGVDVTPATITKFRNAKDEATAQILERIYTDELTHVEKGLKWFRRLCEEEEEEAVQAVWQDKVKAYCGPLRPPFNADGRHQAGLTPEFYMPLAQDRQGKPVVWK
eukprot:CAMPEP_0177727212 /NCGR_PEP_ID=MMETSP0484_2-20121128/20196_1 /TAXON_ID=354590 /ORGANISM="Rhodomonas lens, Strain RHODO" /LENGTH=319 /DNA_ID=CAMNT_0019239841 /DNA_START=68 /DNA_END=1027 /DNA_ORIENTATION=+